MFIFMEREYHFNRSLGMLSRQVSIGLGRYLTSCLQKRGFNIEPASWSIISFLMNRPDQTQSEIVDFLWINKIKVNRILNKLEQEGILKREINDKDKRYNRVNLTEKGKTMYDKALICANESLSKAFEGFTEKEEKMLIDMLLRVKDNLDEKNTK